MHPRAAAGDVLDVPLDIDAIPDDPWTVVWDAPAGLDTRAAKRSAPDPDPEDEPEDPAGDDEELDEDGEFDDEDAELEDDEFDDVDDDLIDLDDEWDEKDEDERHDNPHRFFE